MTGGLFDPLGTDDPEPARSAVRPSAPVVVAGLAVAALVILIGVSYLRDDGDRGRPVAVAPIEHVQAPPTPAAPQPPAPATATALQAPAVSPGPPPPPDDREVEIQNGVRIIRPRRDGPAQGSQTIRVPGTASSP